MFSLALLLFAIASTGTPGPNNMMIMASGLNFGIKRSVPHWLGIISGVPVMVILLGLGLEQVFHRYPASFLIIKVVGGGYLLFLAYKISQMTVSVETNQPPAQPMTFIQALLFQWVNPKAWVMCIGAIAAFTVTEQALLPQIFAIAATFMIAGLVCVGTWMSAGQMLQKLIKNTKQQRIFNRIMGVLLAVSIVPMML